MPTRTGNRSSSRKSSAFSWSDNSGPIIGAALAGAAFGLVADEDDRRVGGAKPAGDFFVQGGNAGPGVEHWHGAASDAPVKLPNEPAITPQMVAWPSPMSMTPAFSPGPWMTHGALVGSFFSHTFDDL